MADQEKSVLWVVAMVMLLIAAFGWAFAAAGYAHSEEGWRSGGVKGVKGAEGPAGLRGGRHRALHDFIGNAFRQIPNLPAVVGFTLKHRLWLAIVIVALEVLALGGGYGLKRLEQEFSRPRHRSR